MNSRWAAMALSIGLLGTVVACTHDGGATVASVHKPIPEAAASAGSPVPGLAFVACMRDQGIVMADPPPGDTTGRSSLIYELDVKGQGDNPAFQTALDKCIGLLPPAPAPSPVGTDQLSQELAYAQCMRDHGVKNFADPNPDGSWRATWIQEGDKTAEAAASACEHLLRAPSASTPS